MEQYLGGRGGGITISSLGPSSDRDNNGTTGRLRSDLIDREDDDPLPRVRGALRLAPHTVHWPPSSCTGDSRAGAQVHQVEINHVILSSQKVPSLNIGIAVPEDQKRFKPDFEAGFTRIIVLYHNICSV